MGQWGPLITVGKAKFSTHYTTANPFDHPAPWAEPTEYFLLDDGGDPDAAEIAEKRLNARARKQQIIMRNRTIRTTYRGVEIETNGGREKLVEMMRAIDARLDRVEPVNKAAKALQFAFSCFVVALLLCLLSGCTTTGNAPPACTCVGPYDIGLSSHREALSRDMSRAEAENIIKLAKELE